MARIIIQSVAEIKIPVQFYEINQAVTAVTARKIYDICMELKKGRPIQYILGETVFYNCRIKLNYSTLIPRPETEELTRLVIGENSSYRGTIADIGTGSGCIAVALAANLPSSDIMGIDVSGEAIKAAKENALINNVKVRFTTDDIMRLKKSFSAGIIVSNPPYVRESEKRLMNRNVIDYEPHNALFVPDDDPLVFYRAILKIADTTLVSPGKIYFEINEAMGREMYDLMEFAGYSGIKILKDINGKDRFVKALRNG
jgi:release factor glutamine methyltransferase